jgi:hypothetical protein
VQHFVTASSAAGSTASSAVKHSSVGYPYITTSGEQMVHTGFHVKTAPLEDSKENMISPWQHRVSLRPHRLILKPKETSWIHSWTRFKGTLFLTG